MMVRMFAILVISAAILQFALGAPPSIRSPTFFGGAGGRPSFSLPSSSFSAPSISSLPSFSGSGAAPSLSSFTPPSASSSFSAPPSPSFSLPNRGSAPAPAFPEISASSSGSNSQPNLPDPQQALATLSSISNSPSFATGLRMVSAIPAIASQMAPSQSQLVNQPSTEDNAVDLPAPASSASTPATATAITPIRGQSPFPYQPNHFIDPTNNPTNAQPQPPADSCTQTDFTCQAYKQCYPCYTNTGLSQCMPCLNLMRCTDANCQLKQMCNLCKVDSSMAVCPMAQPYCPL